MRPDDFQELCDLIRMDARKKTMVRSMCAGKQCFETKTLADRTIRRTARTKRAFMSYHCRVCGGWHVGGAQTSRENRLVKMRRRQCEFA